MEALRPPDEIVNDVFGIEQPHEEVRLLSSTMLNIREALADQDVVRRAMAYGQATGDSNLFDPETQTTVQRVEYETAAAYIVNSHVFAASIFER